MPNINFSRRDNESEEAFLWRLGNYKESGIEEMQWSDVADIMNQTFRDDESEYRTEAAYRKPYQQVKRFYDAGIFADSEKEAYLEAMRQTKQDIQKAKQQLSDERCAINRKIRTEARTQEDLSILKRLIQENGRTTLKPSTFDRWGNCDNDLVVAISDFHIGLDVSTNFGEYNSEIAAKRLEKYISEIAKIAARHESQNVYVCLLGDMISGQIHMTTQLENRENVTEQVQKSAELLSAFVYELSRYFSNVYVNGVAGNHSRTSFKDQVLRGNRLDNLIPWYMKAKLSHLSNVFFIDNDNYDSTIGKCTIRSREFILVHGDFDSYSESGVSKLVLMLGHKPHAILYGHMHQCAYDDIAGVKIIRSGSFCGTADDFTISKRLYGGPSQMVCVVNDEGVQACYPVSLI